MKLYVLLFIALFMFHEMEEICGFSVWLERNMAMLKKKYPFWAKEYEFHSTEGFAAAVYEEFIVLLIVSFICIGVESYGLWFGMLLGFTGHLIVHIIFSIVIRQYIPALITSVLVIVPCVLLIFNVLNAINVGIVFVIFALVGLILMALNLKLSHLLMNAVTKKLYENKAPK